MKHQPLLLVLSLSCYLFSPLVAVTSAEEMVQITPAIKVTPADFKVLKESEALMIKNQKVADKILRNQNVQTYSPVLPKTHIIAANSIHTLLNQIAYAELAQKFGVCNAETPRPGDRFRADQ